MYFLSAHFEKFFIPFIIHPPVVLRDTSVTHYVMHVSKEFWVKKLVDHVLLTRWRSFADFAFFIFVFVSHLTLAKRTACRFSSITTVFETYLLVFVMASSLPSFDSFEKHSDGAIAQRWRKRSSVFKICLLLLTSRINIGVLRMQELFF